MSSFTILEDCSITLSQSLLNCNTMWYWEVLTILSRQRAYARVEKLTFGSGLSPAEAERGDATVSTSSSNESLCSRSSRDQNSASNNIHLNHHPLHHHNHHHHNHQHQQHRPSSHHSSSYHSKQQQHSSSSNSSSPPLSSKRQHNISGSQASMSSSLPSSLLSQQLGLSPKEPLQQQKRLLLANGSPTINNHHNTATPPTQPSYHHQQQHRDLRSFQHSSISSSTPSQYVSNISSSTPPVSKNSMLLPFPIFVRFLFARFLCVVATPSKRQCTPPALAPIFMYVYTFIAALRMIHWLIMDSFIQLRMWSLLEFFW